MIALNFDPSGATCVFLQIKQRCAVGIVITNKIYSIFMSIMSLKRFILGSIEVTVYFLYWNSSSRNCIT